ncbi:FAD-dependent oxidoreductase, partial [Burkholderia guangdongensis]|uniref:FAD-dependent oxidoreductase n=1 Tax=Burkholderia guangdongensis TaxID=1792500 RepID=UPI001FE9CBC4
MSSHQPEIREKNPIADLYEVAVVGAGFAGVTAARDISMEGHSVVLLEARDRIGGRTYLSEVLGRPLDMIGLCRIKRCGKIGRPTQLTNTMDKIKKTPRKTLPDGIGKVLKRLHYP